MNIYRAFVILILAGCLDGCAPGGGIGLVALINDKTCQQQGYQPGSPEYSNCRTNLQQQQAPNNAAMQAYYQRQQELATERMNRQQTCVYNGSNIGGMTSGTMTCQWILSAHGTAAPMIDDADDYGVSATASIVVVGAMLSRGSIFRSAPKVSRYISYTSHHV
jgi:hypothetical protein